MIHTGLSEHHLKTEVIKLLTQHGITPTQQRITIGRVLFAKPQHLSADQILETVNARGNKVSKATVYNTLGLFSEKGLIREVIVDPSKVFYDSNTRPHYHFYNERTGCLHDIDASQVSLPDLPAPPDQAQVRDINIVIRVQ